MVCMRAEKYLREVWPAVTRALKEHCIGCELNLVGAWKGGRHNGLRGKSENFTRGKSLPDSPHIPPKKFM